VPSDDEIQGLVDRLVPQARAFGADYIEEMHGIAEGADLPFAQVFIINARTELLSLARRQAKQGHADGCTGAVIMPERSRNGRLIHGQNWDWLAECVETAVVLRVEGEGDAPALMTFTEAGGLGRSGLNSAGIAITANYLESDRDYKQDGVPLALIRRKVLEQTHAALAIKVIATTPKCCSNNMMLSQAEGLAIDFECAPDETFQIYPERDLIVHANHWQSPVALAKLKDTGIGDVPDSLYRDWRVRRHLESVAGGLTMDDLKAAFFDDFGDPYSVCRPRNQAKHDRLSATVAMVVMEPAGGFIEIAPMPAENRQFTRYSFDETKALHQAIG
jgi:isopenicillin-N N-acyltransferase-like protein